MTLLSALAVGQVIALERRTPRSEPLDPLVAVGHDLSDLFLTDFRGETIELGWPSDKLLLVFDPDCVHSARVAEAWASWLATQDSGRARTYAVSAGRLPEAVRYAREMGWKVRVGSIDASGGEHPLTRRTPWVFAVGADGGCWRRVTVPGSPRWLGRSGAGEVGDRMVPGSSGAGDGRGWEQVAAGTDCTFSSWELVCK